MFHRPWSLLRVVLSIHTSVHLGVPATGKYALESLQHPRWLALHWRRLLPGLLRRARRHDAGYTRRFPGVDGAGLPRA